MKIGILGYSNGFRYMRILDDVYRNDAVDSPKICRRWYCTLASWPTAPITLSDDEGNIIPKTSEPLLIRED